MICLEPTDNTLQLGCLGNLVAQRRLRRTLGAFGPAVARRQRDQAWRSDGLRPVFATEARDVEIEGLVFREVISATQINGGIAANVIPARVEVILDFRYAPDRSPRRPRHACAS